MDQLHEILLEADQHEVGVVVATNNPRVLRERLYKVMKELNLSFTLTIPNEVGKLWIVRKDG